MYTLTNKAHPHTSMKVVSVDFTVGYLESIKSGTTHWYLRRRVDKQLLIS